MEHGARFAVLVMTVVVCKQLTIHKQLYGESVLQLKNSAANCIIESSEVLELQQQNTQAKQLQREADVEAVSKPQQLLLPPTAADSNSSISPVRLIVDFHVL